MQSFAFVAQNWSLFGRSRNRASGVAKAGLLALIVIFGGLAPVAIAASTAPEGSSPQQPQSYDFVILALSWSPSFCASSARRGDSPQCQNPANRGFVLHGLWPQATDGARLRCPANKGQFSKALFERASEIFPDLGLAQSQWQRHGQCFGFAPDAYIEKAAAARGKVIIPEQFRSVKDPVSLPPENIRKSFVSANSGLSPDAFSVSCRKSELVEVLVCLKSDLSGFASCPQVTKRSCRAATIQVPALSLR